jgi:cell wall-associated NlpC family hydrolase
MSPGLRTGALSVILPLSLAGGLQGQALEGRVGQFYEGTGWTLYRVGVARPLAGPFGLAYHGTYLKREGDGEGAFAGLGADLTAFRGSHDGPYLVAGVGGGLGSPRSRSFSSFWGGWSAGAGYQLFPLSVLAFNAEARWREMSLDARNGMELSAGFSVRFGGRGSGSRPARTAPPPAPVSTTPRMLRVSVVATAAEAMGRPYRLGGTGADGGGFDCSGLIQYAYAQHGIDLPRTSRDQAREGRKLARKVGALAPGDLLTFSNRGGPVTHVGLYLGEGRFIHSATRGVQVSVLSADDPYGRWWYTRWVGARRIVDDEGEQLEN